MIKYDMLNQAAALPARCLERRRWYWLGVSSLLLLASVLLSLCLGAKPIALDVVWHSLLGPASPHSDSVIIWQARVPRTLLGLLVGAALGVAGVLMQALTRNPLADPGILGVNAGAGFAIVLGVVWLDLSSPYGYLFAACIGAALTSVVVYALGSLGSTRPQPLRLILAGVALGAVLAGLGSGITLLSPVTFDKLRYWNAGTLDVRDLARVLLVAPVILCGLALALWLARALNVLNLGYELALALGTHPGRTQALAVLAITLLCGASVASAGPIGFVGLMVPQLARWMGGPDQRWMIGLSLLLAPSLLLLADVVGRLLLVGELRVSLVTAFIGAPVLIWLARR